jgi:ATP-dependent Clp protease protease subunit
MENADHKIDHKLKAKSEDPLWHLHEYDVDLQSNHIYLFGIEAYQGGQGSDGGEEPGVEYVMANRFIRNINLCMRVNPDTPIVIHMKTCGGDWTEGMAIYDAIKACPFPVTILSYTHARSMSSLIFQAANKRVMMPHSTFMFHDGTLAVDGTVKQVNTAVEFGKIADKHMMKIYVDAMKANGKFSSRSRKFIEEWLREQMDKKEDVYLTAEQAVELGFADKVFDYNWANLTEYTQEEVGRG